MNHCICFKYHLKASLLMINRNRLLIYCIEHRCCGWLPVSDCIQSYRPRISLNMTDMETRCCVRTCPTNIHQGFLTNRSKKENFCFIAPSIFYFYLFLVYSLWFVSSYPSPSWLITSWETSPAVNHEVVHACERHSLARRLVFQGNCFRQLEGSAQRNSAFVFPSKLLV